MVVVPKKLIFRAQWLYFSVSLLLTFLLFEHIAYWSIGVLFLLVVLWLWAYAKDMEEAILRALGENKEAANHDTGRL